MCIHLSLNDVKFKVVTLGVGDDRVMIEIAPSGSTISVDVAYGVASLATTIVLQSFEKCNMSGSTPTAIKIVIWRL